MYLVVSSVVTVTCLLAWLGTAYFSAKWLARRLGLAEFRLFDVFPQGTWGRRVAVRGMSVVSSLGLVLVLAFVARMMGGDRVATNRVEVVPGPAMEAGLQNGDHIVSIDGRATPNFDAIRSALKPTRPTHEFQFERDGKQATVVVSPDEQGAVKIRAVEERRPSTVFAATRDTTQLVWQMWKHSLTLDNRRSELMGPVAITAIVSGQPNATASAVMSLVGIIGSHLTLLLVGCHLFDWVTSKLFLWRTGPEHVESLESAKKARLRLMRRRQALSMILVLVPVLAVVITGAEIQGVEVSPLSGTLLNVFCAPLVPLVWLLATQLYGRARAVVITALQVVPLVGLGIDVWLWIAAGRAARGASTLATKRAA